MKLRFFQYLETWIQMYIIFQLTNYLVSCDPIRMTWFQEGFFFYQMSTIFFLPTYKKLYMLDFFT